MQGGRGMEDEFGLASSASSGDGYEKFWNGIAGPFRFERVFREKREVSMGSVWDLMSTGK
jgi:hypothetical protein